MVNHGRSGGCATCRRRRVKCDEAKPECRRCEKLGVPCEGYDRPPTRLRFRNENQKLAARAARSPKHERSASLNSTSTSSPRPPLEPDTTVEFFLTHYATAGRCLGALELLVPALASTSSHPSKAPLPLVVSAVGRGMLSVWRHGPAALRHPHSKALGAALAAVRVAVQDPLERSRPTTLLAVIVLQFYENIVSTYNRRRPSRTHFDGAISLSSAVHAEATPDTDSHLRSAVRTLIPRYLLHFEVRTSLRTGRPLPDAASAWVEDQKAASGPPSPVAALDVIGASISRLQVAFVRLCTRPRSSPSFAARLAAWQLAVEAAESHLAAWAATLPAHWHPVWLVSPDDFDPSIPTYTGACDAYAACQVASAWNSWRLYGVALAKMKFALLGAQEVHRQDIQDLVDNICHSLPFYLGNRTRVSSMVDFTDPDIHLPYHPSLEPEGLPEHVGPGVPSARHRRHVLAQGPWHAMGVMVWLLRLVAEEDSPLLLRPGQLDWIRTQFNRTLTMLWLGGDDLPCYHALGVLGSTREALGDSGG
jgi:Zn(2)-Cys(6) binuclear cluster domain-containing protein